MPAKNQINYRAEMEKPEFSAIRHKLRSEMMPTRHLDLIVSELKLIQQGIATGFDEEAFWSGINRLPVDGVIFVGESGSGKSFGLKYALTTLPAVDLPDGTTFESKPLFIDTPTAGTVAMLAREIAKSADGVETREPKDVEAPMRAINALKRHQYTVVGIDEVSRILNPQRHGGRAIAVQSQLVWTLGIEAMNQKSWPTPMALAGLPVLLETLSIVDKKDDARKVRREAQRRFNVVRLPNLDLEKDGEMLESAIATYCSFAGVETMHKETDLVVARLIHASYHQVGTALEIAQKAVALARVRARGKLNLEDFAAVYERMTSSVRSANPFVVEGWDRIDIGVIAPRSAAEATIKTKGRK